MTHHDPSIAPLVSCGSHLRAPERTAAEVARRLRDSSYPALRHVCCDCRHGVVTLTGRVPSYHSKQVAQTLARQVDATLRIMNRLLVVPPLGARDLDDQWEFDTLAGEARRLPLSTVATIHSGEIATNEALGVLPRPR